MPSSFFAVPVGLRAFTRCALFVLCAAGSLRATTVRPPAFDALVNNADYVVHARVISVTAEKRTEARGRKIVTRVELEVIEPVIGAPPARLALELLGGQVGKERLVVEGSPVFRGGEENVLFVKNNGQSICPLVGMMHGRYLIEKDPATGARHVLRNDGLPVRSTSDVAAPNREIALDAASRQAALRVAMTAAEFIREIKAAAQRRNREQ